MGQNSTGVAYDFGQLGSAFTNLGKPIFPPKDHVIVAIQFLGDNSPSQMITEVLDVHGPQFPGTSDTEATDANYMGVTEAAVNAAGDADGNVVLTASNSLIKPGQFVIIGADGDTIDTGITIDEGAGHVDPVYAASNRRGIVVKSIDGVNLVLEETSGNPFNAVNLDNANTLYFLDEHHGAGGTTTEGVSFPGGMTIYGRWTKVVPAEDTDGGVICYFGK
jgi:hypothetical protein